MAWFKRLWCEECQEWRTKGQYYRDDDWHCLYELEHRPRKEVMMGVTFGSGKSKEGPKEYLIYEDRPAYPSNVRQRFDAILVSGQSWKDLRELLPPTLGHYKVIKADNKEKAMAQARKLWQLCQCEDSHCPHGKEPCRNIGTEQVSPAYVMCQACAVQWEKHNPFVKTISKEAPRPLLPLEVRQTIAADLAKAVRDAKAPPPSQTLRDVVLQNKKLLHDHGPRFQEIFGVSLVRWMDPVTGFDIIKFDDQIVKSGSRQMAEVVKEKYGAEAEKILMALIGSGT